MNRRQKIKQIEREEYYKCATNPEYFMKKYCKIQDQQRGKILFNLYGFQERALEEIEENRFNVILKARQMGISTLMAAYALWLMVFNNDKNILVVALKQKVAANLVKKTKIMHDNLPNFLRLKKTIDNRLSMTLSNQSQIVAETTTGNAGRSESLSLLIIDEAAFIDGARELWSSIQATLSQSGGSAVVLSCVVGDTHVFTDKGIQTIDELSDPSVEHGSYEVDDYFVHGKNRMRKGFLFHSNGKVETKKITTNYSEIEGSCNHKLYAHKEKSGYGYYRMDELQEGDFINVQSNMQAWGDLDEIKHFEPSVSSKTKNVFNPEEINEDLAYIMGLYISEGSSYKVTNKNGDLIGGNITLTIKDDVQHVFDSLGLKISCHDDIHKSVSSKNLIELFEHLGFNLSNTASQKKIPSCLMKMSKKNMIALLQGIFDGDGNSTNGKVSLASTSEKLVNQVRAILLNDGIFTTKYVRSAEDMNKNRSSFSHDYDFNHDCFILHMSKSESVKFFNQIGFRLERKQKNDISYVSTRHNPKDVLPSGVRYINEMFDAYPKGTWSLKKHHNISVNGIVNKKTSYKSDHVSRTKVSQMVDVLSNEDLEIPKSIDEAVLEEDSRWCKVTDISDGFAKTYDFSLPSLPYDDWDHSVIYNGVLGHQTPYNVGNWFHEIWTGAVDEAELIDNTPNQERWEGTGSNDFHPIKLHWSEHPDRDSGWREEQSRKLPEKKAAREYDCSFESSGSTVIGTDIIQSIEERTVQNPEYKIPIMGSSDLWVWKEPEASKNYVVSSDVARGDEDGDFSTVEVFETDSIEQVAEYRAKVHPDQLGQVIYKIGMIYNQALAVVERNQYGFTTLQSLINASYPNLLYTSGDLKVVEVNAQMNSKKKVYPGLKTTRKTRPLMVSKFEEFLRKDYATIRSKRLVEEMKTFVYKSNNRADHIDGFHDDLIFATMIMFWARDTAIRVFGESRKTNENMVRGIKSKKTGQGSGVYTRGNQTGNPYYDRNSGEDMSWLLG